jgi:hypothetical protein
MIAFLLTMTVLGALIFAGYRSSKYLYLRGAMEVNSDSAQSIAVESFSVRPVRAAEMEERDYGLRYARVGLIVIGIVMLLLVLGLLFAIFAVL